MKLSKLDYILAYRKAKVDVFYSSISRREDLMLFEADLEKNLEQLMNKVTELNPFSFTENSWTAYPVSVESMSNSTESYSSDVMEEWAHLTSAEKNPKATFRVMESLPIEFHVLSSLWIRKIGDQLDRKLSESVYGCRLRRKKESKEFNLLSLGNFDNYIAPFRKWRTDGVSSIREQLDKNKRVIAISADVNSYYHSLDVSFLKNQEFLDLLGLRFSEQEKAFHFYFIDQMIAWAKVSPFEVGLPVGLSASGVIANIALYELDRFILEELSPIFYGRYVDDVILVLPTQKEKSRSELWKWMRKRSSGLLRREKDDEKSGAVSFVSPKLGKSKIVFKNKKNRVFNLSGAKGLALLKKIEANLSANSSEWRGMPDIPEHSKDVAADLLKVLSESGDPVTSLKDTNFASIKRSELAMKLRDYEAYARSIPQAEWKDQRRAFLCAFCDLIVTPLDLFSFFPYLWRVFTIGIASGDYEELKKIILKMVSTLKAIRSGASPILKALEQSNGRDKPSASEIWERFENLLKEQLREVFQAATSQDRLKILFEHLKEDDVYSHEILYKLRDVSEWKFMRNFPHLLRSSGSVDLFAYDLANLPYRYIYFPEELRGYDPYPLAYQTEKMIEGMDVLEYHDICSGVISLMRSLGKDIEKGLPTAFMFPTRPFHLHELHVLESEPFSESQNLTNSAIMLSQRGYSIHPKDLPKVVDNRITFPSVMKRDIVSIAVTSFLTEDRHWKNSVHGLSASDSKRFWRVCRLIDQILDGDTTPDYVVFPELSMPAGWFIPLAMKLNRSGISLIAGVEYIHALEPTDESEKKHHSDTKAVEGCVEGVVRNQVWVSLPSCDPDFPAFSIYKQDKQRAAIHEERELKDIANKKLIAQIKWDTPPILSHCGFDFSVLICSEFGNITNRATLRGKVDALIVPEWNKDTGSFNSLVESASSDIHAYIVQCNNRLYGDSRIRLPATEPYERDLIRVKGGEDDYFVVGKIDIKSLRVFQSNYRSPSKPFKPVPDGFQVSSSRKNPKKS